MDQHPISPRQLSSYIEHTLIRPETTARDIEKLCAEAREYHFHSVCVNSSRVEQARYLLEDTRVKVVAAIGFPFGAMSPDAKRVECEASVDDGAHEIDVVINIGRFKDDDQQYVLRELRDVAEAADERPVKVILETCLLSREEKIRACLLVLDSGAHFVQTCTGFNTGGATIEDVKLMREVVGLNFGVKASGGIHDLPQALAMIKAGATRLGTSSGADIVKGFASSKEEPR